MRLLLPSPLFVFAVVLAVAADVLGDALFGLDDAGNLRITGINDLYVESEGILARVSTLEAQAVRSSPCGKLVVFGGEDGSSALNGLVYLENATQTWLPMPSVTTTALYSRHTAVAYGSRIVAIGGVKHNEDTQTDSPSDIVEVYNGFGWLPMPPLQHKRYSHTSTVYHGELFVLGGCHNGSGILCSTEQDTASSSVETLRGLEWLNNAQLLSPIALSAAVTFQDEIYVLGGIGRNYSPMDLVQVFNGSMWREGVPMPGPRWSHAAVVFQGELFVLGGFHSSSNTPDDSVYSFNGSTWKQESAMVQPRAAFAAAVFHNMIIAIGGATSNVSSSAVEAFDGSTWSAVNTNLDPTLHNHAAVVFACS